MKTRRAKLEFAVVDNGVGTGGQGAVNTVPALDIRCESSVSLQMENAPGNKGDSY